jgi:putative intracellular protease/amidase
MTESSPATPDSNRPFLPILMALPDHDFDPTEAAIPWQICTCRGLGVAFSTEQGDIAEADLYKLSGPLANLLSGGDKTRSAYRQMTQDPVYRRPVAYAEIDVSEYAALLLPGGDALRMRPYLESAVLRSKVLQFWQRGKLIGAICHGLLVLARTIDPDTGHSVLYGHKLTALPKSLDRAGHLLFSRLLGRGYLMYSSCVADEVRSCLQNREDFSPGPGLLAAHVVSDGNLITARWYMDAGLFGRRFADEVERRI